MILDATTVNEDNFIISANGENIPVIESTVYLPMQKQIRIYLNENLKNYLSKSPYFIMSDGVKDKNGQAVMLSAQTCFNPENSCELYDISVSNVWFKQNGVTLYTQPEKGECTVCVKVINSSTLQKDAMLRIYAENAKGNVRILSEEQINLDADGEIEKAYQISFAKGEKIDAVLVQ